MTSKEWKDVKFSDIVTFKYGKMPVKNKILEAGGYPIYSGYRYVGYYNEYNIDKNTLVIVARGVGGTGDVKLTKEKCYLTNLSIAVLPRNNNLINIFYLYYYFLLHNLRYLDSGSAQSQITISDLEKLVIKLPPLETQEKIARVLSSLDDKIELNNKINQNLEQQAQAIFKSRFIDFEPFGGKMPDDWKKSNLLEIANYLNGLAMQKYRPKDNEPCLPVLKIKELRQGFCDNSSDVCTGNINNAYIINNGDIIFSWSGSLLVDIWCGGKCGLNQHLFKVTSEKYDKWFYYFWTKHYLSKFIALASDMATTMGHIKREELEKSEVIIPNKEEYQKINSIISPILNLIINNKIQNKQLAQLRDTLLPKLMSGEIDVDKVEV